MGTQEPTLANGHPNPLYFEGLERYERHRAMFYERIRQGLMLERLQAEVGERSQLGVLAMGDDFILTGWLPEFPPIEERMKEHLARVNADTLDIIALDPRRAAQLYESVKEF